MKMYFSHWCSAWDWITSVKSVSSHSSPEKKPKQFVWDSAKTAWGETFVSFRPPRVSALHELSVFILYTIRLSHAPPLLFCFSRKKKWNLAVSEGRRNVSSSLGQKKERSRGHDSGSKFLSWYGQSINISDSSRHSWPTSGHISTFLLRPKQQNQPCVSVCIVTLTYTVTARLHHPACGCIR